MTSPLISPEERQRYQEEGYLVVPGLLTAAEADAFLKHEAERAKDVPYNLHGHTLDPQYRYLATHPAIAGRVRELLGGPPRIVQTMFLDKPAAGGVGIALHQDSLYLPNEPNTLMACWVALTDTDAGNGGLAVVPGSHHDGLRPAHRTQNTAEHVSWEHHHTMRDRDGREWQETLVSFEMDDLDPDSIVRLTVPKGSGVFFTGLTIHGSFSNRSEDRRRPAFAIHYVREGTWVFRTDVQNTLAF
ncbi:MAG TPA: phytanoyl-CoA dioxygenase family protein [Chthonomonadaceae bacterium]|nr:phytanoyl-CoA dioxygenase family protein [Chthonomonadaceae bacterium]